MKYTKEEARVKKQALTSLQVRAIPPVVKTTGISPTMSMNVLAERAIKNGTYTIGIMPQFLVDREIAAPHLDEFYVTDDMDERKAKMLSLADACLALPGGPGTLEEISEAFSWARVGQNPNPCAFYNVNGYYDKLADFFDHM